eukprot:10726268-Lingulodinium_polyedra.AAC.1
MGFQGFPADVFTPHMRNAQEDDLPWNAIVGVTDKTPWWKCKAGDTPCVYADLALLRMVYADEVVQEDELPLRWMSALLRGKQLVRRKSIPVSSDSPDDWYFAMGDSLDSACLLWPATRHHLPGCHATPFFIPKAVQEPIFGVVVELSDWESWPYAWKSPLQQLLDHPAARVAGLNVFKQVGAFVTTKAPQPLLVSAARA